jgi:hypothetical protein
MVAVRIPEREPKKILNLRPNASLVFGRFLAGALLVRTASIEACLSRSAPVPGRSNVRKQWRPGAFERAGQFGPCCARGRAHSGGTAKMRPFGGCAGRSGLGLMSADSDGGGGLPARGELVDSLLLRWCSGDVSKGLRRRFEGVSKGLRREYGVFALSFVTLAPSDSQGPFRSRLRD